MSDHIESAAFQHDLDDAQRGSMETLMAELEADAIYVAEMEARDAETLAGIMEANALASAPVAMPALQPIAATCRPVPAKMLAEFEGVFDVPVRSVATRVANHVATL